MSPNSHKLSLAMDVKEDKTPRGCAGKNFRSLVGHPVKTIMFCQDPSMNLHCGNLITKRKYKLEISFHQSLYLIFKQDKLHTSVSPI